MCIPSYAFFFFFNDTATTEIYTLSLHDALPIFVPMPDKVARQRILEIHAKDKPMGPDVDFAKISEMTEGFSGADTRDRKSTRLNSSHANISYAVFCLKKKKNTDSS